MAEAVELPFGVVGQMAQGMVYVIDGGPDHPGEWTYFCGKLGSAQCKVAYRENAASGRAKWLNRLSCPLGR